MLETYKYLVKFNERKNLELTNEQLVDMYKFAKTENERSQAYSSLFIKNFSMLLKISNKYNFIDSSEKACLVSEELVKSINSYDGSTKFITYLTNRVSNLYLWEYNKRKKEIHLENNTISIDCLTNDKEVASNNSKCKFEDMHALEDKSEESKFGTSMFLYEINRMFEKEMAEHNSNSCSDKKYIQKLELAKKVIEILLQDDKLVNSQIARMLGLFVVDKKTGKYNYVDKPNAPDYKVVEYVDEFGKIRKKQEVITHVKEAKWYKIDKINKFIRELFTKYGLDKLSCTRF